MYATRLCVYKYMKIIINIFLAFIKYYKLQWIMVVNVNGGHIVELGVDKSALLL